MQQGDCTDLQRPGEAIQIIVVYGTPPADARVSYKEGTLYFGVPFCMGN